MDQTVPQTVDVERFRLRRYLDLLAEEGELEVIAGPTDLVDIGSVLAGSPKAVLFRHCGGAEMEVVGNVMASRQRLALAFGTSEKGLLAEVLKRAQSPIAPVEVSSAAAPVHQVVWTGKDADFTRLPVHLQHSEDGGPYISASIDISRSFDGAKRNVGYRRLMLRGRAEAGVDLVAPSDLKAIYGEFVKRKERMPIAFALGSHPADGVAAVGTWTGPDELALMGALRGAPVPLVRAATVDAWVPADAEMILEGYLDERGWCESEGPYGEFLGYYGHVKTNPVFHLTAITMRRDALFQTATIGGRDMAHTDTGQLNAVRSEAAAWAALSTAVREPIAVYAPPSSGGVYHLRLSLRQRFPGDARNALAAVLGSLAETKHMFVVDEDIDIFSDAEMEWAMATRFQADRDLMVMHGLRAVPLDPSLEGRRTGAKLGFDLTLPFASRSEHPQAIPAPPTLGASRRQTVREALSEGPCTFRDLMEAAGSRDGRDVLLALEALRQDGGLELKPDGRYHLTAQPA